MSPLVLFAMRVVLVLLVAALAACSFRDEEVTSFVEGGIAFEVPQDWSVTGFSETVWPRRLVAASYPVALDDVEGDCGGFAAVERLPSDGVYVVLIDYGRDVESRENFTDRLPIRALRDGQLAEFECFGRSFALWFILDGRALQAHVGLGSEGDVEREQEAIELLNSLTVDV